MTAQLVPVLGGAQTAAVPQTNRQFPPVVPVVLTDGEGVIMPTLQVNPEATAAVNIYSEAPTPRTASGSTSNLYVPSGLTAVFVGLNVTAVSGTTPSMTLMLQQQDANGVWQTFAQTAAITAAGTAVLAAGPGMVAAYPILVLASPIRVAWNITGTSPSFTFQVGMTCR